MGEWNGFLFRRATEDDEEAITQLMLDYYFPTDAITVCSGIQDFTEYANDYKKLWMSFLPQNLSFVAIHIETQTLAAVRLNYEHRPDTDFSKYNLTSRQMQILSVIKKQNDATAAIFEKYPQTQNGYGILIVACVSGEFRRFGLCTEMYRRSLNICRARGYYLVKTNFNNPYSRKSATNLGFVEVARLKYADVRDSDGSVLLPFAPDDVYGTQNIFIL